MEARQGGIAPETVVLIRAAMPRVAAIVADKRAQLGAEHVTECQRRGLAGEPGWFFAREGAVAVGTPWAEMTEVAWWQATAGQAVVVLRPASGSDGGGVAGGGGDDAGGEDGTK